MVKNNVFYPRGKRVNTAIVWCAQTVQVTTDCREDQQAYCRLKLRESERSDGKNKGIHLYHVLSLKALQRGINVKTQREYLCNLPLTTIPGAMCVRQKKPQ